jgi:hypothetical protein
VRRLNPSAGMARVGKIEGNRAESLRNSLQWPVDTVSIELKKCKAQICVFPKRVAAVEPSCAPGGAVESIEPSGATAGAATCRWTLGSRRRWIDSSRTYDATPSLPPSRSQWLLRCQFRAGGCIRGLDHTHTRPEHELGQLGRAPGCHASDFCARARTHSHLVPCWID